MNRARAEEIVKLIRGRTIRQEAEGIFTINMHMPFDAATDLILKEVNAPMIRFAKLSGKNYFRWEFPKREDFDIRQYLENELYVHDCDECNFVTTYWVVMKDDKPTFWKCYHSYWIEDSEDCYVRNEFEITEIAKDQIEDRYAKECLTLIV